MLAARDLTKVKHFHNDFSSWGETSFIITWVWIWKFSKLYWTPGMSTVLRFGHAYPTNVIKWSKKHSQVPVCSKVRNWLNNTKRFIFNIDRSILSPWPTKICSYLFLGVRKCSKQHGKMEDIYAKQKMAYITSTQAPQEFQLSTEDPQIKSPFSSKIGWIL